MTSVNAELFHRQFDPKPVRCEGCGNEIDPGTCGCGSPIDHPNDGHSPIPMGCDCGRDIAEALREPSESELPAVLEKHATRLAELGHYDIAADVQLAAERLAHG